MVAVGFAEQLTLLKWPLIIPAVLLIPTFTHLFIPKWVKFDKATDAVKNPESDCSTSHTYDFIVVGGGAAGMIVATRIANNSKGYSVLLLEAGGEPSPLNEIPMMNNYNLAEVDNQWVYAKSLPPNNSDSNDKCGTQRTYTSRGKMLGGSSSLNFQMYVRGNQEDYNTWAKELGDPQWNFTNVLPYFKKSENYNGYYADKKSRYHGKGGLLNIATYDFQPGLSDFLAAGVEKGYKVGDYNGDSQIVFSPIDVTTKDGYRESTYRAFLKDTGKPKNLIVKKFAVATKINFNRAKRAISVDYTRHGIKKTVKASKEIILSAGALNSPQLLLLSGVGPRADLNALKIPVVKDSPEVGNNLQDHIYIGIGPFLKGPSFNPDRDITPSAALQLAINGTGVLAAPFSLAGLTFLQSPNAIPSYPNLQAIQLSISLYAEFSRDVGGFLGLSAEDAQKWIEPYLGNDARFFILNLNRPRSSGALKLSSNNPFDSPMINPNYFCDPEDIESALYGVKKIVDLFETTSALNVPLLNSSLPGCETFKFKSDDYYRCIMRRSSGSIYHHVGTCAMGKVVNSKDLKVIGISGLRIIDASVIHKAPNGNTVAPVMMVAEKGADMILKEWKMALN